jgi:hypothetical protein
MAEIDHLNTKLPAERLVLKLALNRSEGYGVASCRSVQQGSVTGFCEYGNE